MSRAEPYSPCDWDQESYCINDGCHRPATHRQLAGLVGDNAVYELVCCLHARPQGGL